MGHWRYIKVGGRPVFKVLIPSVFLAECGANKTLATALLSQLKSAAHAAGVGEPLARGGEAILKPFS
jgi:hypothetical protein